MSELTEPPPALVALLDHLARAGAAQLHESSSGPHLERLLAVGDLQVRVRRDYTTWFVDLGWPDGEFFPASFWVQAVRGTGILPDPVVGDGWFIALDEVLDVVVADPDAFRPRLDVLDAEYRRQLSARLRGED